MARLSSERLQSKTYCKVIDIDTTASGSATASTQIDGGVEVTFEDTAGDGFDANWCEVTFLTSATTEGYGWVQPFNSDYNTTGTKNNVGNTIAQGAGALGVACPPNQAVRMDFGTGKIDEIALFNIFGVAVRAFVNYGKNFVSGIRTDRAGDAGEQ